MNVILITEVRIYKVNDKYFTDGAFAVILDRYIKAFDGITLITRVIASDKAPASFHVLNLSKLKIENSGNLGKIICGPLPKNIKLLLSNCDLVIFRLPSLIAFKIYPFVKNNRKKILTEVMGCAWDSYWNRGIAGKILASFCFFRMRRMVKNTDYCIYVTQSFLQNRYPCRNRSIAASNVNISIVQDKPKKYTNLRNANKISLMTAAALNVPYKGQKYVIKAIKNLRKSGINAVYFLAGKGDPKSLLKKAKKYKLEDNIVILGMLTQEKLHAKMREIDIYIQPSLQEGLPRSLIEAMSQGCICLGAHTAGIPELLDEDKIFKRKSHSAIEKTIKYVLDQDLNSISQKNINKSRAFIRQQLDTIRNDYLMAIINDLNGMGKHEKND